MRRKITLHTLQKRTCKRICDLHLHMSKEALRFAHAYSKGALHLAPAHPHCKEHAPRMYTHASL